MPSSDVPPHQWDADGTPLQEVMAPNSMLIGESSESSPRRSLPLPLHRREDLLVPPMPTDESRATSRAPPDRSTRDRGASIKDHHRILRDTGPETKSRPQSSSGELSRGGPVRQSCAFTGVSRALGKAPDMAWGGMGQDHPRVVSSVDKEDAPRRKRANPASTTCTVVSPCASTPHSDAGVESRIAVPLVSRGIYRETHSTHSVASVPEE